MQGAGAEAVAIFTSRSVEGVVLCSQEKKGVFIEAHFKKLPPGNHGFHIHRAGDLRGEGCLGACDHFHKGQATVHGGPPGTTKYRHTGDLGNITANVKYTFLLEGLKVSELFGRSFIVHADADDYGLGKEADSAQTGHSGKRIACAIIGRGLGCK